LYKKKNERETKKKERKEKGKETGDALPLERTHIVRERAQNIFFPLFPRSLLFPHTAIITVRQRIAFFSFFFFFTIDDIG